MGEPSPTDRMEAKMIALNMALQLLSTEEKNDAEKLVAEARKIEAYLNEVFNERAN